jgi:hypothetical protein
MSARRFISYGIFYDRRRCWILLLNRTAAEWIINFQSRIGWNSGSPEYHYGMQLSQLSDGLLNISNRLAICELRQSETRSVTKTIFVADHTCLYKTVFWWNFTMIAPESSHTKNVAKNSAFHWLLIWLISTYGLVTTAIWSPASVLDTQCTNWNVGVRSRFEAARWVRIASLNTTSEEL